MRNVAFTVDVEQDAPPQLDTWQGMEEGLPALIDILSKYGVPATFFVTGEAAKKFPKLISKISKEHEVGCHGFKHERFDKLSAEEQPQIIETATKILVSVVKRKILGFRAPNFRPSVWTFPALKQSGYIYDASNACYRIGPDPKPYGLQEIQNTWPSSLLRLPTSISTRVLRLCLGTLPLTVLDFHPWELVEMKNIRFDCRFATGKTAIRRIDLLLKYLLAKNAKFTFMRELVEHQSRS